MHFKMINECIWDVIETEKCMTWRTGSVASESVDVCVMKTYVTATISLKGGAMLGTNSEDMNTVGKCKRLIVSCH